ncbi:immunoglobulin superfamily member 2-like [Sander lucioperca]|uniref:immunoglobulin superfamily member 2-like n=1 Tax=Sander lucioperca TaxID=283035 RepID=UPI00125D2F78|nr:immunoglobulin superfamily member 2-like [Sander lucioperca]XP_031151793.1 immunoglobulin superfamily member 2-like [Sander lucioperca]
MKCSLRSCLRANLLFCLGLLLHCGEARVHTEAQAGPLYRVVGSPLSISCNVSGFDSASTRKGFEFRVKKPANPTFEINIISTNDQAFGYAVYTQRVRSGDINLTHVNPNSVFFEIQRLEKGDEGEYDCSVINHQLVYDGTYNAKTTVKVIDNSLSVSSPASTSLSYYEGDALTLTCQASSNTVQHTHLSLAWYLHKDGEDKAQPIISLDRDFTLIPGPGFEERYQAGLIRLDKMGEAMYKLNMAHLELSDQGRIYCQAQEWIQDPDRSWYTIAQKNAEETIVNVKAREVVPDTSSLVVRISAQSSTLQEGQELSLSCNVDTQNLQERFFSVAWLRGSVELARIGPTGILSVGPEYSGRVKEGELRAARIGDRDYRLILQPVRTEDQGEFTCRAWLQDRGQDGVFTQAASQDSKSQLVNISATESGLSVEMQNSVGVNEGEGLKLTCKVRGVKGPLSVTWQRKSASTSTAMFTSVISLSQEGVLEKAGEFMSRKVKATRPATDTFTLELDEVTPSDSGVYQCAVSEWKINSKTNSQSQTATVTVAPTDSFVKVSLISRNNIVTVGANVQLMCRIKGPRMPITLTWSLQRDPSTLDNILTLYSDGAISWSGDQQRYQLKVENKQNEVIHFLLINGASHREAGSYQCRVSVFLENVHKKLPPSNQLAVLVRNPDNKLRLTTTPALTGNINTDIEIKCSVTSEPSASSRYAITWLLQQQAENKTIVSSDQDALVTFGPQVQLSHRQRISMRRTKGPSFEFSIRQARVSDNGLYVCEVVEWLQDPHGDWYQLSPVSKTTQLTVIEPANDLSLDKKEQPLTVKEGDEVELKCNIISGASSSSFFYKVTWLYNGHDSSATNALVQLDHTGLLSYPENQELRGLQGRLRLIRPTQNSFYLGIQRVHEGDSGTYQCQVEQYQLDHEGHWQQKASDSAGPTVLTVNVAEKNLSIVKEIKELNVSRSQDFTVPCHITKQSSSESEFKVTWFWQKETETEQHPIFTSYRNSTLQDFRKGDQLRFDHPLPNQFSLTVLKPSPVDSGLYFCEVEEWLPSLSHGWRKVAVEKSGYLTVNVYAEGDGNAVSEPECKSGIWMGILIATVICSLLVILLLVLKICRSKVTRGKQSGQSLWTEQHTLNPKLSVEN